MRAARFAVRVQNRRNQVCFRTIPVLPLRKFNHPTRLLTLSGSAQPSSVNRACVHYGYVTALILQDERAD